MVLETEVQDQGAGLVGGGCLVRALSLAGDGYLLTVSSVAEREKERSLVSSPSLRALIPS